MKPGRGDALSLLRSWADESSLLYCEAMFKEVSCSLEGRLLELSDKRVKVRSDDGLCELAFAFDSVVCFDSAESVRLPRGKGFDFGLVAFFDNPKDKAHPESVILVERKVS